MLPTIINEALFVEGIRTASMLACKLRLVALNTITGGAQCGVRIVSTSHYF